MRSALLLLALLTGLPVTACSIKSDDPPKELKKSSSLPIEKIVPSYGAFADGTKLELFVAFNGDGFLLLRDGDTVAVDVNGTAVTLNERIENDERVHYVADLPAPPAEPVVAVTFTRGAEKVVGTVNIAPAFEIKTPPTTAKLGAVVPIDIEPRPDLTSEKWRSFLGPLIHHVIEVHGDCIDEKQKKIELCNADSKEGTCMITYPLQWDTSKILLKQGATGCEVDVQLRLETGGANFEGKFSGPFEGLQHRRFKLALSK